ncbi:polyphosphate polymerase domain-containing protein [Desulfitobacterium hafniense]|uniref:VTC domain-containing protein n=4 Tax=Desulfitobacterium hafniense TaxID=49338 RepID=Q24Y87_DESHY|nr:polyphosphate polymerase domain-containing protein [Desulfitobacterium hafniense]ACL20336.1 conserved hypothetical protein [Desulfitobacterium hafniense DCB-2]EHL05667.1 VTC domain protein [Desulfitobacterium hafniense DP7]KTE90539.1 molecular chaperone [Desulfitobacterium hafniense]BAE83005.1 hypothetical protein DSY1216 [Desulfitobacterium hafniense Y51]
MSTYQSVFKRYEKKYMLNEEQYRHLLKRAAGKVKEDKFKQSRINTIYFDTPDYHLISASLEKPLYKEKLRLRSYGTPHGHDQVFVELKKKFQGVVYKRRTVMSLEEAVEYLYHRKPARNASQITQEIDWFLKFYGEIGPAMYISYERLALSGIEDPGLRITFDQDILWRQDELDLSMAPWGRSLLAPGQRLMEIKIAGAMPLWLAHILDELAIYPSSFSKYGKAYLTSSAGQILNKGGKIIA